MSDRSKELRRQKELLLEQLAWIDREIAAEERKPGAAPAAAPPPLVSPGPPADDRDAESILAEYRTPAPSIARQTKLGCILYFAAAMGMVALAVLALYLLAKNSRAH